MPLFHIGAGRVIFLSELGHPACLLQCYTNWQMAHFRQLFPHICESRNLIPGLLLFPVNVKIVIVFGKTTSLYFIINFCSVILQVYLSHLDKAGWVKYDICSEVCDLAHIYLGWLESPQQKHSKRDRRRAPCHRRGTAHATNSYPVTGIVLKSKTGWRVSDLCIHQSLAFWAVPRGKGFSSSLTPPALERQ